MDIVATRLDTEMIGRFMEEQIGFLLSVLKKIEI